MKIMPLFVILALWAVTSVAGADLYPPSDPAYHLVWSDDFNGATLNTSKWISRSPDGTPGRGAFYYLNNDTARIENGNLVLTILKVGDEIHAPSICTKGKFEPKFGYWEARFKSQSSGIGHWSAFWMQPDTPGWAGWTTDPWVSGAEIDIFEIFYPQTGKVEHHTHWGGYGVDHKWDGFTSLILLNPRPPDQVYHTIGVEWMSTPREYIFYIDGKESWRTSEGVSGIPEYIILDFIISTGGRDWVLTNTVGEPWSDNISFDYVRYYNTDATPPVISAVSSSNITTTTAAIIWTTNEPADSQVEYGLSASYNKSTNLNASLVTSHSARLLGLAINTSYHYRAKSRDGAGNLAASADFTFTTFAGERCNNADDDGDSLIDEGCDDDKDTFWDSIMICSGKYLAGNNVTYDCKPEWADLNDTNPRIGSEKCNNKDDDIDGKIDDGCDDDKDTFWDKDMTCNNTYLAGNNVTYQCKLEWSDCNDTDASIKHTCPDLDGNGNVDIADLIIVISDFGKTSNFKNSKSDTNIDGIVDIFDVVFVASRFT
jgi:hypothetical protein